MTGKTVRSIPRVARGGRRTHLSISVEELLVPVLSVLFALVVGAVLILWSGKSPVAAYAALVSGAYGSLGDFGETLTNVTPLIFTGLSVAFAYGCGLFNIGAEGQLIVGQMAAAIAGFAIKGLPAIIHVPLTLVCGMLAGCLWAAVPGFLKARLGIHEVINTIMMNYIALYLTHYLVIGPVKAPGPLPITPTIQNSAKLWRFLPPTRVNVGIFIALGCAWLVYFLLYRTTVGYEIRAVGFNQEAARYGGISVQRNVVIAMAVAGGLAGLAGAVQVQGIQHKFYDIFTFTGYGFDGIAVSLLGRNHPAGVLLGSLLFGTLARGAIRMQAAAGIPKEVIGIVQAVIIIFVAADQAIRWIVKRRPRLARRMAQGPAAGVGPPGPGAGAAGGEEGV